MFQTRSNFLLSTFGGKTVFFSPTLIKREFPFVDGVYDANLHVCIKTTFFCESANTHPKNGLRTFLGLLKDCQPLSFCLYYSLLFDAIVVG